MKSVEQRAILSSFSFITMSSIQEIYARIQEAKKKQKDLKTAYNDALKGSAEYAEIAEKIKALRERKKQVEVTIKDQFSGELTKLEDIKIDIASDTEMLADAAMNSLMKGETVQVEDQYGNQYEPVFKVSFKKI